VRVDVVVVIASSRRRTSKISFPKTVLKELIKILRRGMGSWGCSRPRVSRVVASSYNDSSIPSYLLSQENGSTSNVYEIYRSLCIPSISISIYLRALTFDQHLPEKLLKTLIGKWRKRYYRYSTTRTRNATTTCLLLKLKLRFLIDIFVDRITPYVISPWFISIPSYLWTSVEAKIRVFELHVLDTNNY
jgi:hypothetical protein